MDTTELTIMEPVAIDEFYRKYRDQLQRAYQTQRNLLDEQRLQKQASIMSSANQQGMLYSNFPARTKMQYDASVYNPAVQNLYSSYVSGLDALRNKGVSLANTIKKYQEGIDDFKYYQSILNNSGTGGTTTVDDVIAGINEPTSTQDDVMKDILSSIPGYSK